MHEYVIRGEMNTLFPEHEWDYVSAAVERVKQAWHFHNRMSGENRGGSPKAEPKQHKMLLAFSGGKDSICLFFICKRASEELGIPMEQMFHVQCNITGVDPPELVRFVKEMKKDYPFIEMRLPKKTMWQLIVEKKVPPTRIMRYCCSGLKKSICRKGSYTLTGVRRAESVKRANRRGFEVEGKRKADAVLLDDNGKDRGETEYCIQKNAYICNPIVDWSEEDVWNYIRGEGLPYCKLYDEGWTRIGCIGCPMASLRKRELGFARYPKYADLYKKAFQKMIDAYPPESKPTWTSGEDVFRWWLYGGEKRKAEGLFQQAQESAAADASE